MTDGSAAEDSKEGGGAAPMAAALRRVVWPQVFAQGTVSRRAAAKLGEDARWMAVQDIVGRPYVAR